MFAVHLNSTLVHAL